MYKLLHQNFFHPDSVFVDHLLTGLSQGFCVGAVSSLTSSYVSKNLQSALKEPVIVSKLLKKELDKGYLIGPFFFPLFRISPIGVASRKFSGKKRLIFDLSAPHNRPLPSVTSIITPEPFSLHYSSIENAIKLIKLAGQGECPLFFTSSTTFCWLTLLASNPISCCPNWEVCSAI